MNISQKEGLWMLPEPKLMMRAAPIALCAVLLAQSPAHAQDASESRHGTKIGLPDPFSLVLSSNLEGTRTVEWQDLMPPPGQGTTVQLDTATAERKGAPTLQQFSDISPEDFKAALLDIGDMRSMQPGGAAIRTELDGQKIRIAGYMTPVGFGDTNITEFLLVPYVGACIHVPPPPANQIIYVDRVEGVGIERMWEPVWVTGTLRATPVATVLADVGYSLQEATVEPYE
jgi:hypothetical protein